ncbi:hypothetical protein C8D87_114115 [Lentzea atacamensis]|uniref:Uncharacterized protein n=1 Tax=Lentzea atacamensis TaxID=531938 RepID=A0ABX9DXQ6_9PSEU|nr:hypothetical protein [Lentzea atacamensis]RAS59503.1 hypothetical protein C8D87_114115 [Lentzea atacamensis]
MATDLTITPPDGYCKVEHARWTWADPGCGHCRGTGLLWTPVWDRRINPYTPLHEEDNDCGCVWSPAPEVLEELCARYQSWGNAERARDAWEGIARAVGPREPGLRYRCGYWGTGYTVVSIDYDFHDDDPASPSWQMTVLWDDGRRTTHCTPWDSSRDSIQDSCDRPPAQHPGPAPVPPELLSTSPAPAGLRSLSSLLASLLRLRR